MKASPIAWLALLLTSCFTLATGMELRALRSTKRTPTENIFEKAMGDGRRMFANQFTTMADVYFHSGYYPSIFDRTDKPKNPVEDSGHGEPGHVHHEEPEETGKHGGHDGHGDHDGHDQEEHDRKFGFLGEPRDWIERFGRRFKITEHTELSGERTREILPFLRLAVDMDPHLIQTYLQGAYCLRKQMGKPKDAETFLREGLQNNPESYDILFELGRILFEDSHDATRARNIWKQALRHWSAQTAEQKEESKFAFEQITANLGTLEAADGNWQQAVQLLEMAKQVSPNPQLLQKQIDELRAKTSSPAKP